MDNDRHREREVSLGLLTGTLAFASWGLVPIYWKLLKTVPATEILAHRLVWSFVVSVLLLSWKQRWEEIGNALRSPKQIIFSLLSGIAIGVNWFIFIWAVNSGQVVQTSLGYFITPLVSVLLGALIFHERMRRMQWAAVAVAGVGVLNLAVGYGAFPWIALSLCITFVIYGLLRKTSGIHSLPGLFLESAAILPLGIFYLLRLMQRDDHSFQFQDPSIALLLAGGGVITAFPLLWFAHAARNLKLSTLGFLQYLSPTLTFILGVALYREPFTRSHLFTFACIWVALGIYTVDSLRSANRPRRDD